MKFNREAARKQLTFQSNLFIILIDKKHFMGS